MTLQPHELDVFRAYEVLQRCSPRGRGLVELLARRKTRVFVTSKIYGGFTLNFINMIFIQPLRPDASDWDFKAWACLLAHEACHVEQGYWIDSVEQEMIAYSTQALVGDELGINLVDYKNYFARLNPKSIADQLLAQKALLTMFVGSPAAMVYASLPLMQPTGLRAFFPAIKELAAVVRAGFRRPTA